MATIAIHALDATDEVVAVRAEWALLSASPPAREQLIRIEAWQRDSESVPLLSRIRPGLPQESALMQWALQKIATLDFHH